MAFCNQCGSELEDGARFCGGCGTAVAVEETASVEAPVMVSSEVPSAAVGTIEKPKKKMPWLKWVVIGVVAVAAVAAAIYGIVQMNKQAQIETLTAENAPDVIADEFMTALEDEDVETILAMAEVDGSTKLDASTVAPLLALYESNPQFVDALEEEFAEEVKDMERGRSGDQSGLIYMEAKEMELYTAYTVVLNTVSAYFPTNLAQAEFVMDGQTLDVLDEDPSADSYATTTETTTTEAAAEAMDTSSGIVTLNGAYSYSNEAGFVAVEDVLPGLYTITGTIAGTLGDLTVEATFPVGLDSIAEEEATEVQDMAEEAPGTLEFDYRHYTISNPSTNEYQAEFLIDGVSQGMMAPGDSLSFEYLPKDTVFSAFVTLDDGTTVEMKQHYHSFSTEQLYTVLTVYNDFFVTLYVSCDGETIGTVHPGDTICLKAWNDEQYTVSPPEEYTMVEPMVLDWTWSEWDLEFYANQETLPLKDMESLYAIFENHVATSLAITQGYDYETQDPADVEDALYEIYLGNFTDACMSIVENKESKGQNVGYRLTLNSVETQDIIIDNYDASSVWFHLDMDVSMNVYMLSGSSYNLSSSNKDYTYDASGYYEGTYENGVWTILQ